MLFDRKGLRVFIYQEPIDMRYGFERLHSFCVSPMQARMDQGHLYIFFGKNRRRLKILWYHGTGLTPIAHLPLFRAIAQKNFVFGLEI